MKEIIKEKIFENGVDDFVNAVKEFIPNDELNATLWSWAEGLRSAEIDTLAQKFGIDRLLFRKYMMTGTY